MAEIEEIKATLKARETRLQHQETITQAIADNRKEATLHYKWTHKAGGGTTLWQPGGLIEQVTKTLMQHAAVLQLIPKDRTVAVELKTTVGKRTTEQELKKLVEKFTLQARMPMSPQQEALSAPCQSALTALHKAHSGEDKLNNNAVAVSWPFTPATAGAQWTISLYGEVIIRAELSADADEAIVIKYKQVQTARKTEVNMRQIAMEAMETARKEAHPFSHSC